MATADETLRYALTVDDGQFGAKMNGAARTTERASGQIVQSLGQVRFATRDLGFQISDIGVQLAGGQSPFLIIAQQGPQVADALNLIKQSGAGVGAVLANIAAPAALALVSALYALYKAYTESADAAGKKKVAADALKEALDRLNGASASVSNTTAIGIQNDIAATTALRGREIQTRRNIQAELELARGRLSAAQAGERTGLVTGIPGRGAGSEQANVTALQQQIEEQNRKIADAEKGIRSGIGQLALRQVAGAADKATGATQRYQDAIDSLTRRFEAGRVGEAEFRRQAAAITAARDAALQSISTGRKAESAAASAAKREATEIANAWEKVEIATRNVGVSLGKISGLDLKSLGLGGFLPEDKPVAAEKSFRDLVKEGDERLKGQGEGREAADEALRHKQEDNIRSLADFYESAFTRGSGNIAETFKRQMLAAVATALAQFTVTGKFSLGGGSGGGLGGLIGAAAGLFGGGLGGLSSATSSSLASINSGLSLSKLGIGRASGGYVAPYSIHPVNEAGAGELLRMGGQGGEVIPLGRAKAASGGGMTVIQHISVDGRNSVTPAAFASQIIATANDHANRVAASAGQAAYNGSPARIRKQQVLGS